ncbi:MAG: hypothetical protein LUC45_05600 [Paraprevotella sp.]|nr:hypothetical protein [Paraprevotella sp.]
MMKQTKNIFALVAITVLGAACSSEDEPTLNGQNDPDAVTIKAAVGTGTQTYFRR